MIKKVRFYLIVSILSLFFTLNNFASEDKFVYNSHNKRDPFVSLVQIIPEENEEKPEDTKRLLNLTQIRLEGIICDPASGLEAIINSKVLRAGDEMDGFKVLEILSDRVVLEVFGEKEIIRLKEEGNNNYEKE